MSDEVSRSSSGPITERVIGAAQKHLPYLVKFGLVGGSGLVINTVALVGFTEIFGIHYVLAVVLATQVSTTWNFYLTEFFVFTGKRDGRWSRFGWFALLNNGALLIRGPIIVVLTESLGLHYALSNILTLLALMLVRYWVSAGVLWRGNGSPLAERSPAYDGSNLHGKVGEVLAPLAPATQRVSELSQKYLKPLNPSWWWRHRFISGAVLGVLTLILRFWSLGELGLNSDEAVYTGQGLSLAGLEPFNENFSVFRAHPLLFQYSVAAISRVHFWDTSGRWVAAAFGLATLWVTFRIAEKLMSRRAAWLSVALLAVMPYHVIVSRQALLEAPMTFFVALTMYALVRYRENPTLMAALGIGAAAGLAFLSKETAGMLLISVGLFVALRDGRWRKFHLYSGLMVFGLTVSPHLYASIVGRASEGEGGSSWANYVLWQLSRPPNHPDSFYLFNMPHYFGIPMLILLIAGLGWLLFREKRSTDRSVLLLVWIGVPLFIYQLWPVKGYHYLLPIVPAVAIVSVLGAAALGDWVGQSRLPARVRGKIGEWAIVLSVATAVVVSALNGPVFLNHDRIGDAGYGGLPGVRGLVQWIDEETPPGSRFLGIGPSITNVIAFYTDRETLALSVSPNPVRRNPAYDAVRNADYDVRWGFYEYLIYDAYSAERTSHFANRVLDLADRYSTDIVYDEEGLLVEDGEEYAGSIFRVYEVSPIQTGVRAEDE